MPKGLGPSRVLRAGVSVGARLFARLARTSISIGFERYAESAGSRHDLNPERVRPGLDRLAERVQLELDQPRRLRIAIGLPRERRMSGMAGA
jgi:hypothetical protein